ncbi:MAG: ribonuclease E/G [Lachnospiraceae bacterium]|nr:ribonuclease E/G [Lachnospiraceae bacterium]
MIKNKAVFTIYENKYVLMHIAGNRAEHIYVYDDLDEMPLGTVINCRVERQTENIGASFVRYGKNNTGFINKPIKPETVLALQYKKEPVNDKKALFTDKITIEGEYVVVTEHSDHVKVSSKIPDDKRKQIAETVSPIIKQSGMGAIVRTKAYTDENGVEKAIEEFEIIKKRLEKIHEKSPHLPDYSILYSPLPSFVSDLMYLIDQGIEEVVTDDPEIMEALENKYEAMSGPVSVTDRVSTRMYEDKLIDLCNLYSFNAKISEALSRKVYLKSGVYIMIDQTEALVTVDVNSAGCTKGKGRNDTFLAINLEAVKEIARQIRLRNLSGMIVIDFINMDSQSDYDTLASAIEAELKADRINCRFVDFTGLKLAELVRNRSGRTLYRSLQS